ncbi:MAG: proteasome assembly chaperone family protein [Desulfurococcales archaeon]|nr:proteasome assembly chaperone family protein [Desulfurococcales archaeon]
MKRPLFQEEIGGFLFQEYKEFKPDTPSYLVLGFPDAGLVGSITVSYMVKSLGMEEVAGIDSKRYFPPATIVIDGNPRPPVRVFRKDNVYTLVSEIPLPPQAFYSLAEMLTYWVRLRGFTFVVSVTGIGVPNRFQINKPKLYWMATDEQGEELASKTGADKFVNGIIAGPYSLILKESISRRISNVLLLAESFLDFPDPEAASVVIEGLNKMIGLNMNVDDLLKEAEMIKLKMKELMRTTKDTMMKMGKGLEYQSPIIYS